MLIATRGIVFRTIKYSESSIIADIYTEARGLQSYYINGIRSEKAKLKAGLLRPRRQIPEPDPGGPVNVCLPIHPF